MCHHVAFALLLLFCRLPTTHSSVDKRLNIVLVVAEDLGAAGSSLCTGTVLFTHTKSRHRSAGRLGVAAPALAAGVVQPRLRHPVELQSGALVAADRALSAPERPSGPVVSRRRRAQGLGRARATRFVGAPAAAALHDVWQLQGGDDRCVRSLAR